MRFNDLIFGAALVIFAVAEIVYTRTFPSLFGQAYGPNLFPTLIGIGMLVCGICLIIRGYAQRKSVALVEFGDWVQNGHARTDVLLLLISIGLYISASDWIGFVPVSVMIIALLLYRLGSTLLVSISIAVAVTLFIYFLFARILLVPLPLGLLQHLFW